MWVQCQICKRPMFGVPCLQIARKFFFWLLLKDRLSTRELLRRKTMDLESYNCVLCHLNVEESLLHLFFHCPFAMSCWNLLNLAHLIQSNLLDTISAFKDQIQRSFYMEIIISMCWAIWTARNDVIFRTNSTHLEQLSSSSEKRWL